jgi:hypothetical protein
MGHARDSSIGIALETCSPTFTNTKYLSDHKTLVPVCLMSHVIVMCEH